MDRSELLRRLMVTFVAEMEEHLRALNRDLLALEKTAAPDERRALIQGLFRAAHSLKGASRAVGISRIEQTAHVLEDVLARARSDPDALLGVDLQRVFGMVDELQAAGAEVVQGQQQKAPAAPTTSAAGPPVTEPELLRVSARALDSAVQGAEELALLRGRGEAWSERLFEIEERVEALRRSRGADSALNAELQGVGDALSDLRLRLTRDARELDAGAARVESDLHRLQAVPLQLACEGLDRTIRDLSRASGKDAALRCEGLDVELDRAVVNALGPPLLHLVQNAVDHGLEPAAERARAGKPGRGQVTVRARLAASEVHIEVFDDGRGLNLSLLRERAAALGAAGPVDDAAAARLAFVPGLSTAKAVTATSGRGVGLDVVRARVEELGGRVQVESRPGQGTRFALSIPLTVSTVRLLIVRCALGVFALPAADVRRLAWVDPSRISWSGGRHFLRESGRHLPLVPLGHLMGGASPAAEDRRPAALLAVDGREVALQVDELLFERELVTRPLPLPLRSAHLLTGVALLPAGEIALVLNTPPLIQRALEVTPAPLPPQARVQGRRPKILVVDDSVTTRTLEQSILQAAGYEVRVAHDGQHAWELLQEHEVDLVVADVEMPRLDGFGLTEAIRRSPALRELPVVLVTALENDRDRARGMTAGADAYLVKSNFDQQRLLEVVGQLV